MVSAASSRNVCHLLHRLMTTMDEQLLTTHAAYAVEAFA